MNHGLRSAATVALICLSELAAASRLPAAAFELHSFEVAGHDPSAAIRAFGAQAHIQVFASADDLKGKTFNSVSGEVSTEDGLNRLLAGTGLGHRYVSERTVALLRGGAHTVVDRSADAL
jgi:Secretin and TonB N terminus short domain